MRTGFIWPQSSFRLWCPAVRTFGNFFQRSAYPPSSCCPSRDFIVFIINKFLLSAYICSQRDYPETIIILAFTHQNTKLLQCWKVAFDGALTHRQSLRHSECGGIMFSVMANLLFAVFEYKGLRPDSMEGDYKSPPQYHWMAYSMERSNMIRHNNKRIKKNKNQLDIISTTSHMCLLPR